MNRLAAGILGILFLAILPASAASAQALAASLPEALLLEVVTAPGYAFMDGCADPAMMSRQSMQGSRPAGISPPAAAAGAGEEADHAAHHPAGTGPAPGASATVPDGRTREKTLEELNGAARFFGSLGSGAQTGNVKTEPVIK